MPPTLFLLAGEASGDQRGAELIRALRRQNPALQFVGMGGPAMRAEGMEILADVSGMAVVGIVEVLRHYRFFRALMDRLLVEIERRQPVAVIGVDYPGFNLRLMREARGRFGPDPRLVQYISPQLWAWNERRKWKMARYLDLVLCIFPFEPASYRGTGLAAVFTGHPLGGLVPVGEAARDPHLLALFPGSRERELNAHLPVFREACRLLSVSDPRLRFAYAASSERNATAIRAAVPGAEVRPPSELLDHAVAGAVCSGTATLEAALHGLPISVVYRVAWPTYWMGRALIRVPHLAMPNLLAGRALVREFIQSDLTPEALASELRRLSVDPSARQSIREGYAALRAKLGGEDAAGKAAAEIQRLL